MKSNLVCSCLFLTKCTCLQVYEGGDSDNECSVGFGLSTVRPKGHTKAWPRSVQLGNEDPVNPPAISFDNGGFNTKAMGRGRSPWGDGRKSPPLSSPQPAGNGPNSNTKPRGSTPTSKRTSLWGLSSVWLLHFIDPKSS